jgi:hypothetical protein
MLMVPLGFPSAQAKMEDCTFQVTVNVAYAGPGATDSFITRSKAAVDRYWNKGFKLGECGCGFKVSTNIKKVSNCSEAMSTDPTFHCITVHQTTGVHRANVYREDFTRSLSSDVASTGSGPGQMEAHDSERVIAHEFGHLMGLHDDYEHVYRYDVYDSAGKKVSGPHQISPAQWNRTGYRIQRDLPEGQRLGFQRNSYGGFLISVPKEGVENDSLMATVSSGAQVKQRHVDAIFAQCRFKCPDRCCCGNGRIDASKGEECDTKASPSGCRLDYGCLSTCTCESCGDGVVNGGEECDYASKSEGCPAGEECQRNCFCKMEQPPSAQTDVCGDGVISGAEACDTDAVPQGCPQGLLCDSGCACIVEQTGTQDPLGDLVFEIISPEDGSTLYMPHPVLLDISDPSRLTGLEFWMDDALIHGTEDPGYIYYLVPEELGEGQHMLEVRGHDLDMNQVSDSVSFTAQGPV